MPYTKFKCPINDEPKSYEHCLKVCKGVCERGNLPFLASMIPDERPVIKDQWSTTQITSPPQVTLLKQRYDYADYPQSGMFASWGTAWHILMERGWGKLAEYGVDLDDFLIEQQFNTTIKTPLGDVTFTGRRDLYVVDREEQWDYKTTKAYVMGKMFDEQEEWFWQANIYDHYFESNAKSLIIGGAIRDYGWDTLRRDGLTEFSKKEVPRYTEEEIEAYVMERLTHLKECQDNNSHPRYCTERERWKGWDRNKKADVFRRCERYCAVSEVCPQWQEEKDEQTRSL